MVQICLRQNLHRQQETEMVGGTYSLFDGPTLNELLGTYFAPRWSRGNGASEALNCSLRHLI